MKTSLLVIALLSSSVAFASPLPTFFPSPPAKRQAPPIEIEVDRAQPFRASAFDPSTAKRAFSNSQPFKYIKDPPGTLGKRDEQEEELKMDKNPETIFIVATSSGKKVAKPYQPTSVPSYENDFEDDYDVGEGYGHHE